MQFLASATIGAVTGNKIARYTNANRSFQLKNDALPIVAGIAIPTIISIAKHSDTTKTILGTIFIMAGGIAYLMTPNFPVAEDKQTDNQSTEEENMKSTTKHSPYTQRNHSQILFWQSQKDFDPKNNLSVSMTTPPNNLPRTDQNLEKNDDTFATTNSVTTENAPQKSRFTWITDFFPNPFASQEPKEETPVVLTAKQKRLQKIRAETEEQNRQAEEEKARRAEAKAERAKKIFKEHGLTLEEYEKKCAIETIKKPKEDGQQTLKQAFDRLLKNLDDDLKPYLPAENYNNLRDNINRELRDTLNIDAPDIHDYEKIFTAGDAHDIRHFVGAYHEYKPDVHHEFKEKYSELFKNPDVMGLAEDIAKTLKNSKKVSEYISLTYDLEGKCSKVDSDIHTYVEYRFRDFIDVSAPKRHLTISDAEICYEDLKKNFQSFAQMMNKLEENSLDSIKVLAPEIRKTMLDKCDTHERKQFIRMFKEIVACVSFDKPVDDRWNYNAYDIKHHHNKYISNTLKRPEEKQRLDRINAYLAEFEKISQNPAVFSVADMDSFKVFCHGQKLNLWDKRYNQNPPENKAEYTFDDIKNTQNPLEKLQKIILQASHEAKRFNTAYSDVNHEADKTRRENFKQLDDQRQAEYRAWAKAERERKQQQNTGHTSQSGSQQSQYPNRHIPEAVRKDMFIDSLEHKAIETVNKYLKDNAKPLNAILQEILPHKTSKNEEEYDTKQKIAYRAIMRLIHNDKISKLNISESEKPAVENALKVFSQIINRLNNINYQFQKRKD